MGWLEARNDQQYSLVMTNSLRTWQLPIYNIVDFPIQSGDQFQFANCKRLPGRVGIWQQVGAIQHVFFYPMMIKISAWQWDR